MFSCLPETVLQTAELSLLVEKKDPFRTRFIHTAHRVEAMESETGLNSSGNSANRAL